jgi:hypothetical protein
VDYWRLGVIFGVIFFPGFLPIGVRWMLALPGDGIEPIPDGARLPRRITGELVPSLD